MNLHLLNIQITNFKGISGTHKINLDSDIVFLTGPNGYGKTTIYDAIELCLTGSIGRVESAKGHENANKRHDGSVLHYDPSQDIIVELSISKDNETRLIKVVCPRADSRQQLIDWGKFEVSLLDSNNQLIGGRDEVASWLSITPESYRLFTYLQQSDSTFFLKLAQKDRHMMLNPLLDTSGDYNAELASIESFRKRLTGYNNHLSGKLKSFDSNGISETSQDIIPYKRIFNGEEMQDYDKEDLFKDLEIEAAKARYKNVIESLDIIEQFFEQFIPQEYAKSEKHRYLARFIADQLFASHIALRKVVSNDSLIARGFQRLKLRNDFKESVQIKKYLLRDLLAEESFSAYRKTSDIYSSQVRSLYNEEKEPLSVEQALKNIFNNDDGFTPDEQSKAKTYFDEYAPIATAAGVYGQLLKELQDTRSKLTECFEKTLQSKDSTQNDRECPLCGHDWETSESLIASLESKTKGIEMLLSGETKKVRDLELRINNDFLKPLMDSCNERLPRVLKYELIRPFGALSQTDIAINATVDKSLPAIRDLIKDRVLDSVDDINLEAIRIQEYLLKEITDTEIEVTEIIKGLQTKDYGNYLEILQRLKIIISEDIICNDQNMPKLSELEESKDAIVKLFSESAEQIQVMPEHSLPEHVKIYKELLAADETSFNNAKSHIHQKKKYIEQQFDAIYLRTKKKIEQQQEKIQILLSKVSTLRADYGEALRSYQNIVTKALQLPFYIYSAKILQNSPQCLGVFMFTQQDSGTIVFTPQRGATHDIYHQLSSGQLVVVSMAFYLAINTTFHNQSTALMAIDDPIQDLDSLNIHSLTELLRREFVGKYQLVMSTHDELDVNYMKYKFGTAIDKGQILDIDVQQTFFKVEVPEVTE